MACGVCVCVQTSVKLLTAYPSFLFCCSSLLAFRESKRVGRDRELMWIGRWAAVRTKSSGRWWCV